MQLRILSLAAALLALACGAQGHSWATKPETIFGGGDPASQTGPCGSGTAGNPANNLQVRSGEQFEVERFTGGHPGTDTLKMGPRTTTDWSSSNQAVSVIDTFDHLDGTPLGNDMYTRMSRIPGGTPDGQYRLQWSWGSWFACSDIDVSGACPTVNSYDVSFNNPSQSITLGSTPTFITTISGSLARDLHIKVEGAGDLAFGERTDLCNPGSTFDTGVSQDGVACIDLPKNNLMKYYQIQGSGSATVSISNEGTCEESLSAAASMTVSALFTLAAAVAALC